MTHPAFNETTVRELIHRELPVLVRKNREIHDLVIELGREQFADRDQTEGRIDCKVPPDYRHECSRGRKQSNSRRFA